MTTHAWLGRPIPVVLARLGSNESTPRFVVLLLPFVRPGRLHLWRTARDQGMHDGIGIGAFALARRVSVATDTQA
jgi:hypothetical protein